MLLLGLWVEAIACSGLLPDAIFAFPVAPVLPFAGTAQVAILWLKLTAAQLRGVNPTEQAISPLMCQETMPMAAAITVSPPQTAKNALKKTGAKVKLALHTFLVVRWTQQRKPTGGA